MTEEQIELLAERRMDALDRAFLLSGMTQAEYDDGVRAIDLECNRLLQSLRRTLGDYS